MDRPGDTSGFVGRCQSCRHSGEQYGHMSSQRWLMCYEGVEVAEPMPVKPHHSCPLYEYEPGALG